MKTDGKSTRLRVLAVGISKYAKPYETDGFDNDDRSKKEDGKARIEDDSGNDLYRVKASEY